MTDDALSSMAMAAAADAHEVLEQEQLQDVAVPCAGVLWFIRVFHEERSRSVINQDNRR